MFRPVGGRTLSAVTVHRETGVLTKGGTRRLGRAGPELSAIGLAADGTENDADVDDLIAAGVNWRLVRHSRAATSTAPFPILVAEVAVPPGGDARRALEAVVNGAGADAADVALLRPGPEINGVDDQWRTLCAAAAEGLTRCVGVTTTSVAVVERIWRAHRVDAVCLEATAGLVAAVTVSRLCRWSGIGVLACTPLGSDPADLLDAAATAVACDCATALAHVKYRS